MGYTAHDAVVATVGEMQRHGGLNVRTILEAFRAQLDERWRPLLVGPIPSIVNLYETWVFAPDGSKEYWDVSDEGDRLRQEFTYLLDNIGAAYVHVRFGGDYASEVGATIEAASR